MRNKALEIGFLLEIIIIAENIAVIPRIINKIDSKLIFIINTEKLDYNISYIQLSCNSNILKQFVPYLYNYLSCKLDM